MAKDYSVLPTLPLAGCSGYDKPEEAPEVVHLDDPASYVMLDFTKIKPLTIEKDRRMFDARTEMERLDIHATLVLDDCDCLVGLVILEDILGSKPVKLQEELRVERKQLKVKSIMVKMDDLCAVDYETVSIAQVGHVIKTMQEIDQHYLLVSETHPDTNKVTIRGLFIDSQISRQLGVNIRQRSDQLSIADLQRLLHH
tara:strand:+ start:20058 stop:20651 length:594 start_codon:yes stop_codon:yes gene_type:complete